MNRDLADFLYEQIQLGWLDHDEALRVAQYWLHNTAAMLYAGQKPSYA